MDVVLFPFEFSLNKPFFKSCCCCCCEGRRARHLRHRVHRYRNVFLYEVQPLAETWIESAQLGLSAQWKQLLALLKLSSAAVCLCCNYFLLLRVFVATFFCCSVFVATFFCCSVSVATFFCCSVFFATFFCCSVPTVEDIFVLGYASSIDWLLLLLLSSLLLSFLLFFYRSDAMVSCFTASKTSPKLNNTSSTLES